MKNFMLVLYVLLVSLSACKKDISSEEKVYSASNILAEWKEKGDASPLYQEAVKDCLSDANKGLNIHTSKPCMATSSVASIKHHDAMMNSLIKTK